MIERMIVVLISVFMLTSCAVYRNDKKREVFRPIVKQGRRVDMNISLECEVDSYDFMALKRTLCRNGRVYIYNALREIPLVRKINVEITKNDNSDLFLKFRLKRIDHGSGFIQIPWGLLFVASMGIIPWRQKRTFEMEIDVFDKKRTWLKKYTMEESWSQWLNLFLVFAMKSGDLRRTDTYGVLPEIIKEMIYDSVRDMVDNGIIK